MLWHSLTVRSFKMWERKSCHVLFSLDTKIKVNQLKLRLDRNLTCKDKWIIYVTQCQQCSRQDGREDSYFGPTLKPLHTPLNCHRSKFFVDNGKIYGHSALTMHCHTEQRGISKFGIVKKTKPSLHVREESIFCLEFKAEKNENKTVIFITSAQCTLSRQIRFTFRSLP